MRRPVIYIPDILDWADAFYYRRKRWPTEEDGPVAGQIAITWCGIDQALRKGNRGLPGGSSLAKLLLEHRGRRHKGLLPDYKVKWILAWADTHHRRTGEWPISVDGAIVDAPGETWRAVDKALRNGTRGQPGGSSLAQLLAEERGVRNHLELPPFTEEEILAWADAHHTRTGEWPNRESGSIPEAPPETWKIVNEALIQGLRGLRGGGSLAQFLGTHRGVRNRKQLLRLSVQDILIWADAYHERTGRWPTHLSGPIPEAPGETWSGVHSALYQGCRGFSKGGTLFGVLQEHGRRLSRIQARSRHS